MGKWHAGAIAALILSAALPANGMPQAAAETVYRLPPLDLSTMKLWDYSKPWHASEWPHAFSDTPWKFDHVQHPTAGGDVFFVLDATGAPELKARQSSAALTATWETDVTLPALRSGLDTAPLWLYNDSTKDEVDFEFVANKGLLLTIHSSNTGAAKQFSAPLIPGDWSGRRVQFGINADIPAGWIDMLVDGQVVYRFTRAATPEAFPRTEVRPIISMWHAKSGLSWAENWLGKWTPLRTGETLRMTVHGYRYTS